MLEGVHPKVASERLGHSSVALTLGLYSHVLPGMQKEAAKKIDGLLARVEAEAQRTKDEAQSPQGG